MKRILLYPFKNISVYTLLLLFILTAVNINKAFHIDDTFHLEAAQWIKDNPDKPMSGTINWYSSPSKLHKFNQPPLYFYMIAGVGSIFGFTEIPLHIFQAIFTFLALYFFRKTAALFSKKHLNILLTFFAFSPALIVNQNLMTDVPIVALEIAFIYYLLKGNIDNKLKDYIIAALILGIALLIKYSVLPLLVILIFAIVLNKKFKYLGVLLIPFLFIGLWSLWNYFEYKSIHILDRPQNSISLKYLSHKVVEFTSCVGAVTPFAVSLFSGIFKSDIFKRIVYLISLIIVVLFILMFFNVFNENSFMYFINYLFSVNGLFLFVALDYKLLKDLIKLKFNVYDYKQNSILFFWLLVTSIFIIIYTPFIGTRHILLIIPPILLFGCSLIGEANIGINRFAVIIVVFLGIVLGISDWKYADFYRKAASEIDVPTDVKVWSSGHWGWQWYSKQNGMLQYSLDSSNVKVGDYIVYPGDISKQEIDTNIVLAVVDKKWNEANLLTFFSGNNFASMYNSFIKKPAWTFSKKPIDTVYICRVQAVIKTNDNH